MWEADQRSGWPILLTCGKFCGKEIRKGAGESIVQAPSTLILPNQRPTIQKVVGAFWALAWHPLGMLYLALLLLHAYHLIGDPRDRNA